METTESRCPLCGSGITHEKLLEIQAELEERSQTDIHARIAEAKQQAEAAASRKFEWEMRRFRAGLERDRDRALQRQGAELSRERVGYLRKIKDLERALQQKTSNQLGDGAEIEIFEKLKAEFPEDRIDRIKSGRKGADLVHEFLHKGQVCGRAVIECKNCKTWKSSYIAKLRRDQIESQADHAILCTATFPAGQSDILVQEGVVVITPAAINQVVQILRSASVRMHSLRLSATERSDKVGRLYSYIVSRQFAETFAQIGRVADAFTAVDVEERRRHETTWARRSEMVTRLATLHRAIEAELGAIVEDSAERAANMAEAV